jgi:hypothetical protein
MLPDPLPSGGAASAPAPISSPGSPSPLGNSPGPAPSAATAARLKIKRGKKANARQQHEAIARIGPEARREDVLRGHDVWPPRDTRTPVKACRAKGDRGREYPFYYVRPHQAHRAAPAVTTCEDCRNVLILEQERRLWSDYGYLRRDHSPSGAAVQALAQMQAREADGVPRAVELWEAWLPTEDRAALQAQIDRYLATGQAPELLAPCLT